MVEPKRITKQECLNIAAEINAGFIRNGIPIRPRSDISLLIRETLWLSKNIDKSRNSLTEQDQRRFIDAFLRVEQAKNISNVFSRLNEIQVPNHKLKFLNKRLDRLNREGDSRAPDMLFELEVAGRLARFKTFWNIQFAEPDIVIEFPGGKIGISCKRPKGINRLSERIKEAAKQGNKSDLSFLIIVGVRDIIMEDSFLRFRTNDEFNKLVDDSLEILMNNCSVPINYAFEKGAGGVIFCDRFVAFIDEPNSSINWCVRHKYRANSRIMGIDAYSGRKRSAIPIHSGH